MRSCFYDLPTTTKYNNKTKQTEELFQLEMPSLKNIYIYISPLSYHACFRLKSTNIYKHIYKEKVFFSVDLVLFSNHRNK